MAVAEAQARLNVSLREIVSFLEESGVLEHSVELLNGYIDKHLTVDFLTLAEGYGKGMAFVDHDELISKLYRSYSLLIEGYLLERKQVSKRLKNLKEDKKADPEVVLRNENLIVDLDNKKTVALVICMRLRAMNAISFNNFKDEKYDPKGEYKKIVEAEKHKEKVKPGRK